MIPTRRYSFLLLFFSLLLSPFLLSGVYGQEGESSPFEFFGDIGSYHALRLRSPYDWMTSRNRFRYAVRYRLGDVRFFTSGKLNHHAFIRSYTGVFPREYYLDYTTQHIGVRVGRQIILRGVADGLRLNDILSPMDMSEFLTQEYSDLRIPVNAVRFFYLSEVVNGELAFIPTFQGYKLPLEPYNPWSVVPQLELPVQMMVGGEPDVLLENMEYAGQLSFTLPGIDFSFSGAYTWNKLPCYQAKVADDFSYISIYPRYDRMVVVGADFSKPLGAFVLRGEGAYTHDKLYTAMQATDPVVKKDLLQGLVGVDWYGFSSWMLSVQGMYEYIPDYKRSEVTADEHSVVATLRLSKKLVNDLLGVSSFGYFDVMNRSLFNRFTVDYQIVDGLTASLGYDLFHGEKGLFSMYRYNSELWGQLVYKF